jgi:hypothetical protein
MTKDAPKPTCTVDCTGLLQISTIILKSKSNSLKAFFIEQLESGQIAVPAVVWQEFEEIFDDAAEGVKDHITKKITFRQKYTIGAAALADKTNSQFPRGAYDRQSDYYAASISVVEGITLLTDPDQLGYFAHMGCTVADPMSWAKEHGYTSG